MEGDLRTGLPSQMIEVHEPARLLIAVEQSTSLLDRAIARIGKLRQWLDHEWVRLASVHPASRDAQLYVGGDWERIDLPLDFTTPAGRCSRDIYEGKTETLPVHCLLEDAA
jgi:uncharacterized protein YbcC (UPF0753/DUF2309 family)